MPKHRRTAWGFGVLVVLLAAAYWGRIQHEMADFAVYYTAAERALEASPLYRESDGHYQFKYLPVFALITTPLALMGISYAKVLWFAMSAGLLVLLVRWSVRALPERRRSITTVTCLTVLFMAKFYAHELTLGQTNILLAVLLLGGLVALQRDAHATAGALVGAAMFVKPYAVVLLPWLAAASGIVATATATGVLVAGLLAPVLVYGWDGNIDLLHGWVQTVTGSTRGNLLGADNVSLAAMWAKWIGIGPAATTMAAVTSIALVGVLVWMWRQRSTVQEPAYLECAALMLAIPLLSPQGWDYVLLLGTPAVACLVDRWGLLSRSWKVASGAALALMGLTVFDLMGRALYGRFMALSLVTVAALGVVASLAYLRAKTWA